MTKNKWLESLETMEEPAKITAEELQAGTVEQSVQLRNFTKKWLDKTHPHLNADLVDERARLVIRISKIDKERQRLDDVAKIGRDNVSLIGRTTGKINNAENKRKLKAKAEKALEEYRKAMAELEGEA